MKLLKAAAVVACTMLSTAASAETVKITNIGHGYFSGPLYIAKQLKLFEKYGLEPEISYVQGGALALQSVLTKNADVGILSYEHVLTVAAQGKRIVAFFNIANRPVNNIIANEKLVAGSEKMSVEQKIKRLKGARVALPSANGSGEKMLRTLAHKYGGLSLPGDIKTVYVGAEAASYVAAFQKDLVDAALPFEPAGVLVQQAGKGKIYLNVMNGEIPEFRDILFMTLAAHPDVVKEKPDLLRKVAKVFTEAQHILKSDPKRGKELMGKEYPKMTAETNSLAFDTVSQIWTKDGHMTEAQAKATFAYLQPKGPNKIVFSQTFTNEFLPK
jgi:NitT/TauT family transport system substrate-binding protein